MLDSAERMITPVLSDGEKLLWSGRPRRLFSLQPSDYIRLVLSAVLMVVFFGLFSDIHWDPDASLDRYLVPIFFFLVALTIGLATPIHGALLRARTVYGLTDRRAIIVAGSDVTSVPIADWEDFDYDLNADGSGTITFGPRPDDMTGALSRYPPPPPPAFQSIDNVAQVYELMQDPRAKEQGT